MPEPTYPINCAEAAAALNVTAQTVSRIAAREGIGRRSGPVRLLEKADFQALSKIIRPAPGNPNFIPGNSFGKPPKKSQKKSGNGT